MSSISGVNSAMLGIYRGLEGMNRNAAQIASAGQLESDSPVDLATSMVELNQNAVQVKASASALDIIEETIGTILDIRA